MEIGEADGDEGQKEKKNWGWSVFGNYQENVHDATFNFQGSRNDDCSAMAISHFDRGTIQQARCARDEKRRVRGRGDSNKRCRTLE